MSDASLALPAELTVYRALLYEKWREREEDGRFVVSDAAFFRRPKDEDGVSVHRSDRCRANELPAMFLSPIFGAGVLSVGGVRTIQATEGHLDVSQSKSDPHGSHGEITGVPFKHVDLAEAERIASELSLISTYIGTDTE